MSFHGRRIRVIRSMWVGYLLLAWLVLILSSLTTSKPKLALDMSQMHTTILTLMGYTHSILTQRH